MKTLKTLAAIAVVALVSCQKDQSSKAPNNPTTVDNFADIKAPEGFEYDVNKTVQLDLTVDNPGYTQPYTFEVYDSNPIAGGELLYKGFTSADQLRTDLTLGAHLKQVYLVKVAPTGASTTEIVPLTSNLIKHDYSKKTGGKKTGVISPACNTGCNVSYNNKGGNVNINNNDPSGVYCFTGNTKASINVNRSGVTIRLCGTADINNLNLNHNATLEIVDGATVDIKNLGANSGSQVDIFNANVTIENNLSINGMLTNHGTLQIDKSLNVNNGSGLTNNGTISVSKSLNNNDDLINNGSITVNEDGRFNGGSYTENNCKLIIGDELHINNNFDNHGYIEVADAVKINGGSNLDMYAGAMLYGKSTSKETHINAIVDGVNSTSVLKFDGDVRINGGAGISGNLELCIDGSFTNNGAINGPATLVCDQAYIPTSTCNPQGNGTPTVADADSDNVPDSSDIFPGDPNRAGELFYPGSSSFATIAFEDLWPSMGDYDFNDLVIDYRLHWITDADNKVKDLIIDYKVRAIGAGYKNGFGVELYVSNSAVESVTRTTALSNLITLNSNGTEAGQTNAVIVLFDNATDELPNPGTAFVNTVAGAANSIPTVSQATVTFSNAIAINNLMDFNPFMIVNQNRAREIHLAGYAPTDLGSTSMFGTKMDDSNAGQNRYYVTENNLPWAITTPVSFDYPEEKEDIAQAYNHLAQWAISGGSSKTDWYLNLSGYRNASLIY